MITMNLKYIFHKKAISALGEAIFRTLTRPNPTFAKPIAKE